MKIYRAKHHNAPESPVRTLYGRKGNFLLLPLDVCILQMVKADEVFRPRLEVGYLVAAPIQGAEGGRLGLIARYEWPPPAHPDSLANPVVTMQIAPSASLKGVEDLSVLAAQCEVGDRVFLLDGSGGRCEGTLRALLDWYPYPDNVHRVKAYRVQFDSHLERTMHGSAVRLETGELAGMLIATQNQPDGNCRALVYPA